LFGGQEGRSAPKTRAIYPERFFFGTVRGTKLMEAS